MDKEALDNLTWLCRHKKEFHNIMIHFLRNKTLIKDQLDLNLMVIMASPMRNNKHLLTNTNQLIITQSLKIIIR